MKILAVVSNIVLLAFTLGVLATDGAPTATVYVALTALLLVVPLLNIFAVIDRWPDGDASPGGRGRMRRGKLLRLALAALNVVLIAFVCWAVVDQYPHPEEEGLIAFIAVTLLVPLLSSIVLLRSVLPKRGAESAA